MEELIENAIKGDKKSFIDAVAIIEKELYSIAFIKLNNIEDVKDVLQETLLKAFKYIYQLKEVKYFKTWITKILINECNKFYIKKYRAKKILDRIINLDKIIEVQDISDVENSIDIKSDFDKIYTNLKDEEKVIINLRYFNQYSLLEISEVLDLNINTVKTKLRRTIGKICNQTSNQNKKVNDKY